MPLWVPVKHGNHSTLKLGPLTGVSEQLDLLFTCTPYSKWQLNVHKWLPNCEMTSTRPPYPPIATTWTKHICMYLDTSEDRHDFPVVRILQEQNLWRMKIHMDCNLIWKEKEKLGFSENIHQMDVMQQRKLTEERIEFVRVWSRLCHNGKERVLLRLPAPERRANTFLNPSPWDKLWCILSHREKKKIKTHLILVKNYILHRRWSRNIIYTFRSSKIPNR